MSEVTDATGDDRRAVVEPVVACARPRGLRRRARRRRSPHARVRRPSTGGVDLDAIDRGDRGRRAAPRRRSTTGLARPVHARGVAAPGLERPLRTPEHFRRAVGDDRLGEGARDADGAVRPPSAACSSPPTTTASPIDVDGRRRPHGRATTTSSRRRTVFEWGPAPKPGKGPSPARKKQAADEEVATR